MAKPATLPEWASDLTNVVTPSSGKQDVGFVAGEAAPAQYLNWALYWCYKWCEYLDAGAFEEVVSFADAVTFDDTVDFNQAVTFDSSVAFNGTISVITLPAWSSVNHGEKTLNLYPIPSYVLNATGPTDTQDYCASTAGSAKIVIPLRGLCEGDRIKSVSYAYQGNGTADFTTSIYVVNGTGGASSIGTGGVNNAPASWAAETINVTDTTLGSFESVVMKVEPNASGILIGQIKIVYDRPNGNP